MYLKAMAARLLNCIKTARQNAEHLNVKGRVEIFAPSSDTGTQ
jgi:hypothetical protein